MPDREALLSPHKIYRRPSAHVASVVGGLTGEFWEEEELHGYRDIYAAFISEEEAVSPQFI